LGIFDLYKYKTYQYQAKSSFKKSSLSQLKTKLSGKRYLKDLLEEFK